ncbi:MAG: phosphate ABC transporter permease family protein, partial [Pseudomonadota bacterium]
MLIFTALIVACMAIAFFALSRNRAVAAAGGTLATLHSRPSYHGLYSLLWTLIAGLGVLFVVGIGWSMLLENSLM